MIERGNYVVVKDNLCEELKELGYEKMTVENMSVLVGTQQRAYDIWEGVSGQKYVTVDLCVEIPIQCLEKL